jgi:hypothetical protein
MVRGLGNIVPRDAEHVGRLRMFGFFGGQLVDEARLVGLPSQSSCWLWRPSEAVGGRSEAVVGCEARASLASLVAVQRVGRGCDSNVVYSRFGEKDHCIVPPKSSIIKENENMKYQMSTT